MAKRKHTGTVVIAILVAILLAVGVSGWLFWQSVQRVIGEAQQAGEYAAEAQQSVGQEIGRASCRERVLRLV